VTSSGWTSARSEPARTPAVMIVPIAAVMRSRVVGVVIRPDAQPARRVSIIPRFVAVNTADIGHLEANAAAGAITIDDATLVRLDAVPTRSAEVPLG